MEAWLILYFENTQYIISRDAKLYRNGEGTTIATIFSEIHGIFFFPVLSKIFGFQKILKLFSDQSDKFEGVCYPLSIAKCHYNFFIEFLQQILDIS